MPPAPAQRTWPLLDSYTTTAHASAQAAAKLAGLAIAAGAPSSPLALARAASAPRPPNPSQPAVSVSALAEWAAGPSAQAAIPGPVEQAIQQLRPDDPALLLRAAAIDQAARRLIAQAGQASAQPSPRRLDTAGQQRSGDAARLAAHDCPAGLAIKPADSNPGNRTAARPSSGPSPRPPRRPPGHSRPQSRRTG